MKYFFSFIIFTLPFGAFSVDKTVLEYKKKGVEPQTYLHEMPKICYRGKAKDVPGLIEEMMKDEESVLNQDQTVLAIRFGQVQIIYWTEDFFATTSNDETKKFHLEENKETTQLWEKYSLESKNVLILSNLGPQGDGTELYATVIAPCK